MERPVLHSPTPITAPADAVGNEIYRLAAEIYPICRSITGQGVRDTLDILARHIPLERHRVPTGEQIFDWTVPQEWNIRDAFIRSSDGQKVVDFAENNLHVVGYSMPVHAVLSLGELKTHLHSLPAQPDLVPYRTSYYNETWGFCISHLKLAALADGPYEVFIDSELRDGCLDYGEYVHRGETDREFLLSAHICHPSLANDNCSGLALLTLLARDLAGRRTRYSYRFLFAPGTIGALAWLAKNEHHISQVDHGLVVSCVGDGGGPTYKRSRAGNAFIDRAFAHVLARLGSNATVRDFSPYGYDERQFCSPGFDMPVGLLQNSAFGEFPEYHTSGDDLNFIKPEYLARTYRLIMDVIEIVEQDWIPVNLCPKGEPQLGRRGLYAALGGRKTENDVMALLWVLNLSDGSRSLLDIAERSGFVFSEVAAAALMLKEHNLLAPAPAMGLLRDTAN
jgi:aminopeptidase-like protein